MMVRKAGVWRAVFTFTSLTALAVALVALLDPSSEDAALREQLVRTEAAFNGPVQVYQESDRVWVIDFSNMEGPGGDAALRIVTDRSLDSSNLWLSLAGPTEDRSAAVSFGKPGAEAELSLVFSDVGQQGAGGEGIIPSQNARFTVSEHALIVRIRSDGIGFGGEPDAGYLSLLIADEEPYLASRRDASLHIENRHAAGALYLDSKRGKSAPGDATLIRTQNTSNQLTDRIAITGGVDQAEVVIRNSDLVVSGRVGFNGAAAQSRLAVTGSRGSNAALASLLAALSAIGLISDQTTP